MKRRIPIGVRPGTGEDVSVPLALMQKHGCVDGPTGSGKTAWLLSVLMSLLGLGHLVVQDGKGETIKTLITFLAALHKRDRIDARHVIVIDPFEGRVPLNPMCPIPGIAPEVQANLVVILLASLFDGGMGPRMGSILMFLVRAAIEIGGTILDIIQMIVSQEYCAAVGARIMHPEVREYLRVSYPREPIPSLQALRSRLEWAILLPAVRRMLCSPTCVAGAELISAGPLLIDLGQAPAGFTALSTFMGALFMRVVSAGLQARVVHPLSRHVYVFFDEWQAMAHAVPEEFSTLLSQIRWKRASIALCCQTLAQVKGAGTDLAESLATNISWRAAFRPKDATDLLPLFPISGNVVDPSTPDRLLSTAEERAHLRARLACLPPRHMVFANFVDGHADVLRTLSLPFEEAQRISDASPDVVDMLRRGRFGVGSPLPEPRLALDRTETRDSVLPTSRIHVTDPIGVGASELSAQSSARRSTRSRRAPLVLP